MRKTNPSKSKALNLQLQTIRVVADAKLDAVQGGVYDRKQGATKTCDP